MTVTVLTQYCLDQSFACQIDFEGDEMKVVVVVVVEAVVEE